MQTIPENSDVVAMIAQADIHRFYIKVIQPALFEFAPGDDVGGGETKDQEVFLESARQYTHNALCYEMRRTFVLTLGALFERQLRSWLSRKVPSAIKAIERERWTDLVKRVETVVNGLFGSDRNDIETLWLVANAVRHGNGDSAQKLFEKARQFWDHVKRKPSDLVGNMRIRDAQLCKFVVAVMRFWHRAGASEVPIGYC